jgi:hypothetical protein
MQDTKKKSTNPPGVAIGAVGKNKGFPYSSHGKPLWCHQTWLENPRIYHGNMI